MRPTAIVLSDLRKAADPKAAHAGNNPDAAAQAGDLAAEKARLERALAETQKERSEGRIVRDAQAALQNVDRRVSTPPEAGPPGVAQVRVIGIFKDRNAGVRAPLSGVTVRLIVERETVADEEKTDLLGVATLEFAERKPVDSRVQVIGANGAVLAEESIRAAKEQSPVRLFEVPGDALAGPADRAQLWIKARSAAAARIAELSEQVSKALAKQEEELQALIAKVNAELAERPVIDPRVDKALPPIRRPDLRPGDQKPAAKPEVSPARSSAEAPAPEPERPSRPSESRKEEPPPEEEASAPEDAEEADAAESGDEEKRSRPRSGKKGKRRG